MQFENKQKQAYEEYLKKASEVTHVERKQALESSIYALIKTDDAKDQEKGYPFLGSILQSMSVRYSEAIPTAGVMYNQKSKQFEMLLNPYFFCRTLPASERIAVLLHEMYHITFKHVFFETPETVNRTQLNFAMDLVINQYIKGLPSMALTIDKFRLKDGTPFPPNKTTEIYYDLLNDAEMKNPNHGKGDDKQDSDEQGDGEPDPSGQGGGQGQPSNQPGQGGMPGQPGGLMDPSKEWVDVQEMLKKKEAAEFDGHDWVDNDADAKEKLEALNDLIKRTMVKSSYGYSTMPDHVKDLLKEIETQLTKLNYKAILMSTLRKSLPSKDIRKTWKRPSRRYGDLAKGNQTGLMPKIEVFVDTSGSISVEECNEFLKIANNFLTVGVDKCNISFFHTALYHTEKVKKNFKIEHDKFQSGGTDLTQVFERIKKVKPDLSIIITDGYFDRVNVDMKNAPQMVFIISKGGTVDHPLKEYGQSIKYQ